MTVKHGKCFHGNTFSMFRRGKIEKEKEMNEGQSKPTLYDEKMRNVLLVLKGGALETEELFKWHSYWFLRSTGNAEHG